MPGIKTAPAAPAGGESAPRPHTCCSLEEHVGFGGRSACPDLLVLAASLTVLLWGLGRYGLYEPHEGHFAGVGREMLLSGDWLTPRLDGSPYLNKPPLLYWSIALSQGLFGIGEWAARLPVALYAWLGVLVAWWWGRRLWGPAAGRLAAGMLTVSAGWFLFTHQLLIDVPLSSLQLAALYFFWRGTCEPRARRNWLGLYLALMLALLAKGPVALLFPVCGGVVFLLLRRRWELPRQAGLWWGLPLAALPVGLWALFVERHNPGFLYHILVSEHWDRIRDVRWPHDYAVSQVSAPGYLAATAVWCAPWILLLPQTAAFAWLHARAPAPAGEPVSSAGRSGEPSDPAAAGAGEVRTEAERADGVLILALAFLAPVVLFLPMPSRLIYYCLPALPPFVLLAAGAWLARDPPKCARAAAAVTLGLVGSAAFVAGFWTVTMLQGVPEMQAAPGTAEVAPSTAWLLGGALFLAGLFLWQRRPRAAAFYACVLLAALWLRATDGFVTFQEVRSSKHLVAELNPVLGRDAVWVAEGSYELGASAAIAYYLGTDRHGQPRTVRVMVDDARRPQPLFGEAERAYALERDALQALWDGPRPVVFVTDPMRRNWVAELEAPHLPRGVGAPVGLYGFRRVFANAAARERLERRVAAPGSTGAECSCRLPGPTDPP